LAKTRWSARQQGGLGVPLGFNAIAAMSAALPPIGAVRRSCVVEEMNRPAIVDVGGLGDGKRGVR